MVKARVAVVAAHCSLVAFLVAPVAADAPRPRRSLASCTAFDSRERGEAALELTVRNTCTMPIACTVSWQLICAPQAKKRRQVIPGSVAFTLASNNAHSTEASAAACGDDNWLINGVTWRCAASDE
jgi:hypothetical protein